MSLQTPNCRTQDLADALRRLAHAVHAIYWSQRPTSGLTPTQHKIMSLLHSRPEGLGVVAVAREIGAATATASESIKSMTRRGLLGRRRSTLDGRKVTLTVTEAGKRLLNELKELSDPLQIVCEELPTVDQVALYRIVLGVIWGLEEGGALPASRIALERNMTPTVVGEGSGGVT